ncbi:MAG: hypothetical protein R3224_02470 [Balneolaceae bacterium]|nr:hypothetical protein [Balneolaceae bacterium]
MLFLAGCNDSFQPFDENTVYNFSMYGFLDASADTQWVRVVPARQEFNMPPTIPEVTVTLEDLQSDSAVVMNDSLKIPGDGFNFLNFWTTMNIRHGQTYRLTAEGPDGEVSRVTVTIPEMYPTPQLKQQQEYNEPITFSLEIFDVPKLADVQTWWFLGLFGPNLAERKLITFNYRNVANEVAEGDYTVLIDPEKELEEIERVTLLPPGGQIRVLYRQIYVASAGPDWIEGIASLDDPTYSIPNSYSNVENGLGYVIGIDSKVIPYVSCFNEEGLTPCSEEAPYWYD